MVHELDLQRLAKTPTESPIASQDKGRFRVRGGKEVSFREGLWYEALPALQGEPLDPACDGCSANGKVDHAGPQSSACPDEPDPGDSSGPGGAFRELPCESSALCSHCLSELHWAGGEMGRLQHGAVGTKHWAPELGLLLEDG